MPESAKFVTGQKPAIPCFIKKNYESEGMDWKGFGYKIKRKIKLPLCTNAYK